LTMRRKFKVGDRVVVNGGSYATAQGFILSLEPKGRYRVLFEARFHPNTGRSRVFHARNLDKVD